MPPLARLLRAREAAPSGQPAGFERAASAPPAWLHRLSIATTLELHDGCVNTATWSADGQWLVTGSDDCTIALTRADRRRGRADLQWDSQHGANVFCARLLGGGPVGAGSAVVSCALDGQVRLHTLQEGRRVATRRLHRHAGAAHKVAVSAVNPQHVFASGGEDGRVVLFDLRAASPAVFQLALQRSVLPRDDYALHGLEWRPQAPTQLLLAGGDHVVRLFDLRHVPHSVAPAACYHPGRRRGGGAPSHPQGDAPPDGVDEDGYTCGLEHASVTGVAWNLSGTAFVATLNDKHAYLMDADGDATTSLALQPSATAFAPVSASAAGDAAEWRHPRVRTSIGTPLKLRALPPEHDGSDSLSSEGGWWAAPPAAPPSDPPASSSAASSTSPPLEATRFNPEHPARAWWHTLPGRSGSSGSGSAATATTVQPPRRSSRVAAAARAQPPPAHGGGTYSQCYRGHRNVRTVKGVSFFGPRSELVVQGCDSGVVFFYDTASGRILCAQRGDCFGAVNCLSPHPLGLPVLLTSGLESNVKLWAPLDGDDAAKEHFDDEVLADLVDENALQRTLGMVPEFVVNDGLDGDDDDDGDDGDQSAGSSDTEASESDDDEDVDLEEETVVDARALG